MAFIDTIDKKVAENVYRILNVLTVILRNQLSVQFSGGIETSHPTFPLK